MLAVLALWPQPGPVTALLTALVAFAIGRGPDGVGRGAAALLLLLLMSAVGVAVGATGWQETTRETLSALTRAGVPWLIGSAWRLRTQVRQQAEARVIQKRRQRRTALLRERDAERLGLAESLHDDLGHALSLVALNLGRLEVDPTLTPPARESVVTARRELSLAVERLGASVGSMRSGAAPGLPRRDDITDLLEQARRAGADLRVNAMPPAERLGDFDQVTLVRVLQETVTNATKHASGRPVTLDISESGDQLYVTARNALAGTSPAVNGSGTGLSALDRHLQGVGGHLEIQHGDGEFVLRARLPSRPVTRSDADDSAVLDDEDLETVLMSGAERRGRVILAVTALVIVAVLGAVEIVMTSDARRALLPAEDYAQIRVGDSRGQTEHLLPEHGLLPRPDTGPGTECHDYAVTAVPLDDRSGDVHRICFSDGVVASTHYVRADSR